ncbi:glycosyltransferase [Neobacillus niacini]|uniref:glycosyltransferase n=1 Tax=Neobacillus niacini TaxID=86668 RepID=UPI002FFDCC57
MKVSILIPTYNAQFFITELIEKLKTQKVPNGVTTEIIIVDSSSSDSTRDIIVDKYPEVKFVTIANKEFDHGSTRNFLAKMAKGEYYLFMTQDAIPRDDLLINNLLTNFQNGKVKIAYARQIPKSDAAPLERFARSFNYPDKRVIKDKSKIEELGIKTFFNSNVCSMYDAALFKSNNFCGFPEKVILNEDLILAHQVVMAGYQVIYENNAVVYHSHNYNLKQQFKRYFDIGMAFNETKYILENVSNEKEGFKMVIQQQKFLLKNKHFGEIIYSFLESAAKYLGYYLGKRHHIFSYDFKKKLSAYMK